VIIYPANSSLTLNDTYGITVTPQNTSLVFNERDNHQMYINTSMYFNTSTFNQNKTVVLDTFLDYNGNVYSLRDASDNLYIDKYHPSYLYVKKQSGGIPSSTIFHDISTYYWSEQNKYEGTPAVTGSAMDFAQDTTDREKFIISPLSPYPTPYELDIEHGHDHEKLHIYTPVRFTKYPHTTLKMSTTEYIRYNNR